VAVTAAALWNRFTATPPSDARRPYAATATGMSTSVFHLMMELKVRWFSYTTSGFLQVPSVHERSFSGNLFSVTAMIQIKVS